MRRLILAVVAAVMLAGCGSGGSESSVPDTPVVVTSPVDGSWKRMVSANGTRVLAGTMVFRNGKVSKAEYVLGTVTYTDGTFLAGASDLVINYTSTTYGGTVGGSADGSLHNPPPTAIPINETLTYTYTVSADTLTLTDPVGVVTELTR